MAYKILRQTDMDDIVVSFLLSQERDQYCHEINLARFDSMLNAMSANHPFKSQIQKLRDDTASRLDEVKRIITATEAQLPTGAAMTDAKTRVLIKWDKEKG